MDWLKRNKFLTGIIAWAFAALTTWAAGGCTPVYERDFLAILHVGCGTVVFALSMLGTFLVGGGILNSDKHAAEKQADAKVEAIFKG